MAERRTRVWPSVRCFWDTTTETDGVVEPARGEDARVGLRCKVKGGVVEWRVKGLGAAGRGRGGFTLSLPVRRARWWVTSSVRPTRH